MEGKALNVDPRKCTGCRLCEIVCAIRCTASGNPSMSRIRVQEWEKVSFFIPVSCRQCEEAPCMAVCPREAIYRDETLARVMVDYRRCISCRMCVAACPFGAMGFDVARQTVFKCDLCGGDPQCVRFCYPGALEFTRPEVLPYTLSRKAAGRSIGLKEEKACPTFG